MIYLLVRVFGEFFYFIFWKTYRYSNKHEKLDGVKKRKIFSNGGIYKKLIFFVSIIWFFVKIWILIFSNNFFY
jgi:hypothetical protein